MRLWVKVLLLMFGIYIGGVITGLFVSPSYYEQTKIIGQAATVIQYPAIIGVAIAAWKAISDLYRENVLKYGEIRVKQQHYSEGGKDILRPAYYLRVKRVRGRGRAEDCNGLITIEGTDVDNNTVWDGDIPYMPISTQGDLKLFEISEATQERLLIVRSNPDESKETVMQNNIPFPDELTNRKVTIKLGSSNANVPSSPFVITVGEIIKSAK
jgi:hypothetical protein